MMTRGAGSGKGEVPEWFCARLLRGCLAQDERFVAGSGQAGHEGLAIGSEENPWMTVATCGVLCRHPPACNLALPRSQPLLSVHTSPTSIRPRHSPGAAGCLA